MSDVATERDVRVNSATVSEIVDGVVRRVTICLDIDEARAAAEGLAESSE